MAKRPATTKAKSKSNSKKRSSLKKQALDFKFDFSKEKVLETSGIVLLVFGFISLIMTFFAKQGSFFAKWPDYLLKQTGIFSYVIPIIMILAGAWFLLSRYEQFPVVTVPRLIGAIALIFNLITWFQFFHAPDPTRAVPFKGGGEVGKAIYNWFYHGLGTPGAVIMLIAWLLIALILLVNLSMPALLAWLVIRFKNSHTRFAAFLRKQAEIQQQKRAHREQLQKELDSQVIQQAPLPLIDSKEELSQPAPPVKPSPNRHPPTQPAEGQKAWVLPEPEDILNPPTRAIRSDESDEDRARVIEETLRSFNAPGTVVEIRRGPAITMFGVEPDYIESRGGKTRVRVSNITRLADDLAMALKASRIRMQAPVPGKGYIGIEVPNTHTSIVSMLEIFQSTAFQSETSALRFVLGKDVTGLPFTSDLSKMPHLLIAGTTGSGKSVCVNAILAGYLLTLTPDQLRLMLVDPKRVELTGYNGIPHLLAPVITEADKVVSALQRMMREMDLRYQVFAAQGVRNIEEYNQKAQSEGNKELHYILVVIDELADLMMLAPDETERSLIRLAQLARATGIHLIIATQRPSADILTGLIKANFPARIAFAVASGVDSRVILDQPGAERLLGRGDMLFQPPDAPEPIRLQGTYVSDDEINKLTDFWRNQSVQADAPERPDLMTAASSPHVPLVDDHHWDIEAPDPDADPIEGEVIAMIRKEGRASISMLQRKFRIGYTRSARIIEKLEEDGIIGPPSPSGTREVLDYGQYPPVNED
jgi:S-DNA-T family DNA segregation ATPase FtsK/SpoIIIE